MAGSKDIERLRNHAACNSLFPPTSLTDAMSRLGFVQADPIRSPARAQDLILRLRVQGYRNGDLERQYQALDAEEDFLYAYGFMPRAIWRLLHPRDSTGLTKLEKKVVEIVGATGPMHPKELDAHLGRKRVINAWGGYSKATTRALESLHYRGLLRISRRENGIRIFEAVSESSDSLPAVERFRKLAMLVANILAPAPEKTFRAAVARLYHNGHSRAVLNDLIRSGELERHTVAGVTYVWPHNLVKSEAPRAVRFLAPFDPVVWDRMRFEHLWQWSYRFEAYTPPTKRIRGYYAMPLLWCDRVIGWANARAAGAKLDLDIGFVDRRPLERDFSQELEKEITAFEAFLGVPLGEHARVL